MVTYWMPLKRGVGFDGSSVSFAFNTNMLCYWFVVLWMCFWRKLYPVCALAYLGGCNITCEFAQMGCHLNFKLI